MLILSRSEVEDLLDLDLLVEALAGAMREVSAGNVSMPPRVAALVQERDGLLGVMPVYLPSAGMLETKLVSLFPRNAGTGVPTHQAVIVAFDPETGTPVALMDATSITEIRTAAGSALATRLLAREDASVLAIVGTGVQARSHARAVTRVRQFEEIRVAGRDRERAAAFAERVAEELDLAVQPAGSYAEALDGADVVCATTHALEPVVRREWLASGVHVNSVGLNPKGREVDAETVRDALVVIEAKASTLAPTPAGANDLTWAVRDGVVDQSHVQTEIGEVLAGSKPGRTSPDQITLYKSVGIAAQDAVAAALVLSAAAARGAGLEVEL
ncbi:MAG: ornithine cyclodeaminase family protein [Actinomycetota bacterium]|nr:ornithine cyclodeaminase family protein [Actinomycetota bacterium]